MNTNLILEVHPELAKLRNICRYCYNFLVMINVDEFSCLGCPLYGTKVGMLL